MNNANNTEDRPGATVLQTVSYLRIHGINGPRCVDQVKTALLGSPGVTKVQIDLSDGFTEIVFDPQKVTIQAITLAILTAGESCGPFYLAEWLA